MSAIAFVVVAEPLLVLKLLLLLLLLYFIGTHAIKTTHIVSFLSSPSNPISFEDEAV